jgi:hypothetical protein
MIYSVDVIVYATAYIRAGSPEEALEIAKGRTMTQFDFSLSDPDVSNLKYDDPDLPDFSLSPLATYHGPHPDDDAVVEVWS